MELSTEDVDMMNRYVTRIIVDWCDLILGAHLHCWISLLDSLILAGLV